MKYLLTLVMLVTTMTYGYFDYRSTAASEMNGIHFKDHSDFPTKWHLVTVRFREDSREMRFTYANDLAWKALQALKPSYPDGAKFGKVSFYSEADPAFPSSVIPSGVRRYQLMVKDRKKYSQTDGWGYALFTHEGKLFNESVAEKTMACTTCHRIVPERDFVFSRKLDVDPRDPTQRGTLPARHASIIFKAKTTKDFKGPVTELLAKDEAVESLEGPLKQHAFSGTLDEVVPLLIERVRLTTRTSLLSVDEKNFSLVQMPAKPKACETGKGKLVSIVIHFNGGKVRDAQFCLN